MTREEALKILEGCYAYIGWYNACPTEDDALSTILDGSFTTEEVEAVAFLMREASNPGNKVIISC